jgi:hypothetical protein
MANGEIIPVLANVEVAWRPGQRSGKLNFTIGWADVTSEDGSKLGSVEAKVDGSVSVQIGSGLDKGWTFRLGVRELWRIANEAKLIAESSKGG